MATPRPQPGTRIDRQQKLGKPSKKNMMKTNITNKVRSHRSDGCVSDDDNQPADQEGESSASDAEDSLDDEPDVSALPGAGKLSVDAEQRLVGYTDELMFIEDTEMSDDSQAVAGADMDLAGDDDGSLTDAEEADFRKHIEDDLRDEFERKYPETMEEALDSQIGGFPAFDQSSDMYNQDPFAGFEAGTDEFARMLNEAELSIWRMPDEIREREENMQANPRQKKVRFEEGLTISRSPSYSSSSDDGEEANSQFPDIFMDSNDPAIQVLMGHDGAEIDFGAQMHDGSDAGSVYDFDDDADRIAFELDERSDSDSMEDESDSESDDEGDETEDESLSEKVRKMQELRKALGHKPMTSRPTTPTSSKKTLTPAKKAATPAKTTAARANGTTHPTTPKSGTKGPRMGTFKLDPTKATLKHDSTGKKTVVLLPTRPAAKHKAFWDRAKTAANSRDNSPRSSISIARPGSHELPPRPLTAQATLGNMFTGNLQFLPHEEVTAIGDPMHLTRPTSSSTFMSFASSTLDGDSEMEVEDLDLSQLIHFDDDDSDDHELVKPTSRTEPAFLAHGSVGSFRLNQTRAKHESSLSSNPAERRATAEMNALQTGRRGAGNTPITPARKKRVSQDLSRTGSGVRKVKGAAVSSSPLASRRRSRGQSMSGIDQTLSPGYSAWLR